MVIILNFFTKKKSICYQGFTMTSIRKIRDHWYTMVFTTFISWYKFYLEYIICVWSRFRVVSGSCTFWTTLEICIVPTIFFHPDWIVWLPNSEWVVYPLEQPSSPAFLHSTLLVFHVWVHSLLCVGGVLVVDQAGLAEIIGIHGSSHTSNLKPWLYFMCDTYIQQRSSCRQACPNKWKALGSSRSQRRA